jgi:transposase
LCVCSLGLQALSSLTSQEKRGQRDSFRYPDPKQFKLDQSNGRLFLPKLGWMPLRLSRAVPGVPRNVTVSVRAGKWYASIQTEREVEPPVRVADSLRCRRRARVNDVRYVAVSALRTDSRRRGSVAWSA